MVIWLANLVIAHYKPTFLVLYITFCANDILIWKKYLHPSYSITCFMSVFSLMHFLYLLKYIIRMDIS